MTEKECKSCINTIELLRRLAYNIHGVMDVIDADNCDKIIDMLEQEPNRADEYIKKSDAIIKLMQYVKGTKTIGQCIDECEIHSLEQKTQTDYKGFCQWVAQEIFSINWCFNKDSFGEIACRKLEKLGIVKKDKSDWVLLESEVNK